MSDLTTVADLNANHIGKTVRVENKDGGFIEGTLAMVNHRVYTAYSDSLVITVAFEEFISKKEVGSPIQYMAFEVRPTGSASVLED